jgi:TRAP-type C4-dicarboxylate transport system permease small subunit
MRPSAVGPSQPSSEGQRGAAESNRVPDRTPSAEVSKAWPVRLVTAAAAGANMVAVASLGLTTAVLIYEIVARFVFNRPTGWSDVAAAYLMPAMVFMGAAYALIHDAHIRIDTLYVRMSHPLRRWVALFNETVGLVVLVTLLWFTVMMVARVKRSETMATAGAYIFPEWWFQLLVPLGLAFMTMAQALLWLYAIGSVIRPEALPDGPEAVLARNNDPRA